mmetsp:Transcript_1543/g.2190  ORF Transcript_1543/g.2190 Transcript_1543/m.2190 type:complete len:114 (+) Transcript_1543:84-425(+)|eukprot:720416-Amorphochlora_amoeboformis.AAC.1
MIAELQSTCVSAGRGFAEGKPRIRQGLVEIHWLFTRDFGIDSLIFAGIRRRLSRKLYSGCPLVPHSEGFDPFQWEIHRRIGLEILVGIRRIFEVGENFTGGEIKGDGGRIQWG